MAPQATEKPDDVNGKKLWTVMIYMIADDPAGGEMLDQQANQELDEIIHAKLGLADRDAIHVAVQVDFRTQPDVWRRIIGKGTWLQPESPAADPATLYGFFDWVDQECRAYNYLLLFWGHSRGPFGLFTDRPFSSPMAGAFAEDDPTTYVTQTLTLKELREALGHARECLRTEINIVAFKDCFMSTLETAYKLKDWVEFILASPDIVPVPNWPYKDIFECLASGKQPGPAADDILGALDKHYKDEKNSQKLDVRYTLLDTSKLASVSKPLDAIIATDGGNAAIRKALKDAAPNDPALVDVGLLCQNLKSSTTPNLEEQVGLLEKAIGQVVQKRSSGNSPSASVKKGAKRPKGSANDASAGVCLFCYPSSEAKESTSHVAPHATRDVYAKLVIAKETKWSGVALEAMPPAPVPDPSQVRSYPPAYTNALLRACSSSFNEESWRRSRAARWDSGNRWGLVSR